MFRGRSVPAGLAATALAGAICLAVTACGGHTAASPSAAPSTSARAADPLAAMTGSQVETEALANLKAASSVTLSGDINMSGTFITLNLGIKPGHGCAGTIGLGSKGSLKLVLIGKVLYLNPDATYWKAIAGAEASAAIALAKGRYAKTTTSAPGMSSIARICDLSQVMASVTVTSAPSKGAVTTVNGIRAMPLEDADTANGEMYVTDTSKPEIVQMEDPGNGSGTGVVVFAVGAPVTLTPPPASQVFDGSQAG